MMKLSSEELILLEFYCQTPREAIRIMATELLEKHRINNLEEFIQEVEEREAQDSTTVGFEIALPHGKCPSVNGFTLIVGKLKNFIEWEDGEKVQTIFLTAVPETEIHDKYLTFMALLAKKILNAECRRQLIAAKTPRELLAVIGDNQ